MFQLGQDLVDKNPNNFPYHYATKTQWLPDQGDKLSTTWDMV